MNLYVLSSDVSQGNYRGDFYRFRGMRGEVLWPRQEGFGLGTLGAWNVSFSSGFVPRSVRVEQLSLPSKSDSLFLCAHGAIGDKLKIEVAGWERVGWIPNNPGVSVRLFCATSSVQQLATGKDLLTDHAKSFPGLAVKPGNRIDRYFLQELRSQERFYCLIANQL